MAIMTEFISFIVPIHIIEKKYPGGWEQCLKDHEESLGGRVWHDDYLFRDGAMNSRDKQDLVEHWESLGFTVVEEFAGKKYWKDACIYEGMMGGLSMPCDWLELDPKTTDVSLKGAPPCSLAGPRSL